jgi:hypothetical protein
MIRNLLPAIVSLFVFSILMTACQRDVQTPGGWNNNPGIIDDNITVNAGIRGVVLDENNQPVPGASVVSGTATTTTDNYGAFSFSNINISKNNGYVKVTKAGYFLGTRTFIATQGRTHNVRIGLIPKTNTGNFNAAAGGTISLSTGGKLVMPAAAVTDASGNTYTGTVNVAMAWIDPTSNSLAELVPGDLRGITTTGEERGLETYGMIGVELTGTGNQQLKIATGKTAELSFPIPASLTGTAPATIDLWHFDEATGRWKQEGTATKTGANYVANVSHFSFWNCDAPFPLVEICMTVVNAANNQPLNNVLVRIVRPNNSYGTGRTDSSGNLCGRVPKNEALTLQVMDQCGNVAYSQSIGPFSANTSLGTVSVTIPPSNSLTITGTLTNCANANVTNGVVIIHTNGTHQYVVPVTNGSFSHTVIRCGTGTLNFSIIGIDHVALQQSTPVTGSGTTGTVNVGTIQACGTSSAQFAQYIVDGNVYSYTSPPGQFGCADSIGNWGSYTKKCQFFGSNTTNGGGGATTGTFNLRFFHNDAPGVLPISGGHLQVSMAVNSITFLSPNPVVNVTAFGPSPGGFIEGNFNELMEVSGTPKMVSCTFRIRRN